MNWFILFWAGILEIVWVVSLKMVTDLGTLYKPFIIIPLASIMILDAYLLSVALRSIPMGTVYAIWVGIATAGTTIFGMYFFKESTSLLRILFLTFLIFSVIGLKLTANQPP